MPWSFLLVYYRAYRAQIDALARDRPVRESTDVDFSFLKQPDIACVDNHADVVFFGSMALVAHEYDFFPVVAYEIKSRDDLDQQLSDHVRGIEFLFYPGGQEQVFILLHIVRSLAFLKELVEALGPENLGPLFPRARFAARIGCFLVRVAASAMRADERGAQDNEKDRARRGKSF